MSEPVLSEAVVSLIVMRLKMATLTQIQALAKRLPEQVLQTICAVASAELEERGR